MGKRLESFFVSERRSKVFSFRKKEGKKNQPQQKIIVASPVEGRLIDLSQVSDPVFSQKMMGEGFAVIPESDQVVAPVSGTAVSVFPTGHAVGLRTSQGVDVLIHIGLDTVSLKGEGFQVLVREGDQVDLGEPIVNFDRQILRNHDLDATTMVVFTDGFPAKINVSPKPVKAGDVLIQV